MVKIVVYYKNGKKEEYPFVIDWKIDGNFFVIKDKKNEYNILTDTIWHIDIDEEVEHGPGHIEDQESN